jgi:hypothetical protein
LKKTLKRPGDADALCPPHQPDIEVATAAALGEELCKLHRRMRAFLADQAIALPTPEVLASVAYRAAITECRNALDELRPRKLRGYGSLDAQDARAVEVALAELHALLGRLEQCLTARKDPEDLDAVYKRTVSCGYHIGGSSPDSYGWRTRTPVPRRQGPSNGQATPPGSSNTSP